MKKIFAFTLFCLLHAGAMQSATPDTLVMRIEGMHCDHCANKVMKAVTAVNGVDDIWLDLEKRTATVSYDASATCPDSVCAPLVGTRYNPTPYSSSDIILRNFGQHMFSLNTTDDARRAVAALEGGNGIDSLAPHPDKQYLFIRYDANKTSKADIRKKLNDKGFTPTNYYTSDKVAYAEAAIPAGLNADELADNILALDGVEDVNVNIRQRKVALTYLNTELTAEQLNSRLQAFGLKPE